MLGLRRTPIAGGTIPRSDVQTDRAITELEARVARLEQRLAEISGEDTCPSGYRAVKVPDERRAWPTLAGDEDSPALVVPNPSELPDTIPVVTRRL